MLQIVAFYGSIFTICVRAVFKGISKSNCDAKKIGVALIAMIAALIHEW
jgi:hypothetical protein